MLSVSKRGQSRLISSIPFLASAAKCSSTLTVRLTKSSSPTAALFRWWRFTRTGALSRWRHGREGCTGFQAIFGDEESSTRFLVQIPGSAARMSRSAFLRAMKAMPAFRNLLYA